MKSMKGKILFLSWLLAFTPVQNIKKTKISDSDITETKLALIKIFEEEINNKQDYFWMTNENIAEQLELISDKNNIILQRDLSNIANSPLWMKGVKRNLWELLWYNQVDEIMIKYNHSLDSTGNANKSWENIDTLNYPLIIPELIQYFSETIESDTSDLTITTNENNIIIIRNIGNNQHALWYYRDNKLFLATNISIWLPRKKTPRWFFQVHQKLTRGRSRKYDVPIPYALWFKWQLYYLHQGSVNWHPKSHWCVRVPGLYQEILYHLCDIWTPIVIDENLYIQ